MKQALTGIIGGILGGLIVLLLIPRSTRVIEHNTQGPQAKSVAYSRPALPASADFVDAASKSTPAVVHIYAEESRAAAQKRYEESRRRRRSPFDDIFGGDFFGRNYFRQQNGSGSGVFFSSDGYIVTNNHVVGFADKIIVTTNDGKEYQATKVGTDPSTDLAVIKVEGNDFPTMEIDDSDKLQVGEWVLAVGNPFDYLTSTVTAGIVSAKGRDIDIIKGEKSVEEFIQTDAAINPGNSGGALVTTQGKLVGINTAIATPTGVFAGYSFAIPSNLMKKVVSDIIKYGDIQQITLGIGGYDVTSDLVSDRNLKTKEGFYIEDMALNSPIRRVGIRPGDVIVKIGNKDIKSYEDITKALKTLEVGKKVTIQVNRKGKKMKFPTQLQSTI